MPRISVPNPTIDFKLMKNDEDGVDYEEEKREKGERRRRRVLLLYIRPRRRRKVERIKSMKESGHPG